MKKIFLLFFALCTIANCYCQINSQHLGYAYKKQWYDKNYKEALVEYNKSIELDTTNGSYLYLVRGKLKFILKDYLGAIADYNIAMKKNPNCQYTFGDENEAVLETEIVNVSEIYFNRAETKVKLEDNIGAIADFSEAIKLETNYKEAYYKRGKAKAKLEDFRGAIADFNNAIKNNSNYTIIYYDRGNAKFDLKDYEGAILDYTKRILLYPDDCSEEYFNRGLAKICLKQKNSGCLDLSKAGELGYEGAYKAIKQFCN